MPSSLKDPDTSLAKIESIFKDSLAIGGADDSVLACYFYNPEIDIYWPILQLGKLDYPHLVLGPISNLRYNPRLTEKKSKSLYVNAEQSKILTKRNFDGDSFVTRERIKSAIRLRISDKDGLCVVIFVGYRKLKSKVELREQMELYYKELKQSFDKIKAKSLSPIIDDAETSKRLRNIISSGLFSLTSPLIQNESKSSEKEFWGNLRTKLASLFEGRNDLTVCQIYEVFQDGELEMREGEKNPHIENSKNGDSHGYRNSEPGIVEFVARTGRCVQIENIEKYIKNYGVMHRKYAPRYNRCNSKSKSEICYPVVSLGKILGVINLESSKVNSFKNIDIFVLHHISSLIAIAIKSYSSARSLREVNVFIHRALKLKTREEIFETAVKCIKNDLSYLFASIWDTKEVRWFDHDGCNSRPIRKNGLTNKIIHTGSPIIVVDYKTKDDFGGVYTGQLNADLIFKSWNTDYLKGYVPNDNLAHHLEVHFKNRHQRNQLEPRYLCDIGFPIFSTVPENQTGKVTAVMWVKCSRPYSSITSEDFWFISLVCRRITDNLERIRNLDEKARISTESQINKHIGSGPANNNIRKLFLDSPEELTYHQSDDVIILSMDIRGSSAFCEMCTQSREVGNPFNEFIGLYQKMVRDAITENYGIFDKTVGDGVIGIFNVFNRNGDRYSKVQKEADREIYLKEAKEFAMKAAIQICKEFTSKVLVDFVKRYKKIIPPYGLRMGGALVLSSRNSKCFVGSGNAREGADGKSWEFDIVEFSAYGDVANVAGKLCEHARQDVLISATESLKSDMPSTTEHYMPIGKNKSELLREISEIAHYPHDIIMCSSSFNETVESIQLLSDLEQIKFSCDLVMPSKVRLPPMMGNLVHMVVVNSESLTSVLDKAYQLE